MAANQAKPVWRTPLSTPIRSDENGTLDLFKHLEKLLASAVSICRLKGSVECQTGGLITVSEEMQRLIRVSFSENIRLEKELKHQRANHDDDIFFLKNRVTALEEEKESAKQTIQALVKRLVKLENTERSSASNSQSKPIDEARSEPVDESENTDNLECSDPNLFALSPQKSDKKNTQDNQAKDLGIVPEKVYARKGVSPVIDKDNSKPANKRRRNTKKTITSQDSLDELQRDVTSADNSCESSKNDKKKKQGKTTRKGTRKSSKDEDDPSVSVSSAEVQETVSDDSKTYKRSGKSSVTEKGSKKSSNKSPSRAEDVIVDDSDMKDVGHVEEESEEVFVSEEQDVVSVDSKTVKKPRKSSAIEKGSKKHSDSEIKKDEKGEAHSKKPKSQCDDIEVDVLGSDQEQGHDDAKEVSTKGLKKTQRSKTSPKQKSNNFQEDQTSNYNVEMISENSEEGDVLGNGQEQEHGTEEVSTKRAKKNKRVKTNEKGRSDLKEDEASNDSVQVISKNLETEKGGKDKKKKSPKTVTHKKMTIQQLTLQQDTESESDAFQTKPSKKTSRKLPRQSKGIVEDIESAPEVENENAVAGDAATPKPSATKPKSPVSGSKNKKPEVPAEEEECLGDMSFLIDISSRLAAFVSDTVEEELELPLMTARERNDVHKLSSLFHLHPRTGTKEDHRSTLRVRKVPETKMPRPGKIDNLLSKLSIAAMKEAEKGSPKLRSKRKLAAEDGDKGSPERRAGSKGPSKAKKTKVH